MPDAGKLADSAAGAELDRLEREWKHLEQRRSRLSERSAVSISSSSHLSISTLQAPVTTARSGSRSPRRLRNTGDMGGSRSRSPGARSTSKLEEEREALRAALNVRSRRVISPSNRAVEGSRQRAADERERERVREWSEKVRAIEQDKERMRAQLEEYEERINMLQTNLSDKDREETQLRAELHRANTSAKHDNEMWTQMSEKQQASLLLLQGEKGSLAMKVDALKEENDTLRAKNKNLLHNQQRTGDAHKAEQDAEIALLRKEREGFQADLQASRLQSSVALQRLKDKSDEYELSLQETKCLRGQLITLTEESRQHMLRLAEADARNAESERKMSQLLAECTCSMRKEERIGIRAAVISLRSRFRRRLDRILREWMAFGSQSRVHRINSVRIGRRKRRHLLHAHLTEWLTLIRQSKYFDRLGRGKESLRQQMKNKFFKEWCVLTRIIRTLHEQDLRSNERLVGHCLLSWKYVIREINGRKEMQKWAVRSFLQAIRGRTGVVLSAWRTCTTKLKWQRQALYRVRERITNRDLARSFQTWLETWQFLGRARHILQNLLAKSRCYLLAKFLDCWKLHMRNDRMLRQYDNIIRNGCVYHYFTVWSAGVKEFCMNTKLVCHKLNGFCKAKAFRKWRDRKCFKAWTDKLLPQICNKSDSLLLLDSIKSWGSCSKKMSGVRRLVSSKYRMELANAFGMWSGAVWFYSAQRKRLANVLLRCFFKSQKLFFGLWHEATCMSVAVRVMLGRQDLRSNISSLRKTIGSWVGLVTNCRLRRKVLTKFSSIDLCKSWNRWTSLHDDKLAKIKNAEKYLRKWFWKTLRGAFNQWRGTMAWRAKVGMVINRAQTVHVRRCLARWQLTHLHLKSQKAVVLKLLNRQTFKFLSRWCEAIFYERQMQKTLKLWIANTLTKAMRTWEDIIWRRNSCRKVLATILHLKQYKTMRLWIYAVEKGKMSKAFLAAVRGKILSNLRANKKDVLRAWVRIHHHERTIHLVRQDACKRNFLRVWRRIVVVARIFRQRVYNLLPNVVSRHEMVVARVVTRTWRVWTRRSKTLSVRAQRLHHRQRWWRLHGTFQEFTLRTEHAKSQDALAALQVRWGLKRLASRIMHHWYMEVQTTREEALMKDHMVSEVRHSKTSYFALVCGNAVRHWCLWAVARRDLRRKERMSRKLARSSLLRTVLHKCAILAQSRKRHRRIILCCHQEQRNRLLARTFTNIDGATSFARTVQYAQTRRTRLIKSKLLRCWQQTASIVNLELTFDKQRHKAYRYCFQQTCKRHQIHLFHRWVLFLREKRLLVKFLCRNASKRMSRYVQEWRRCIVTTRLFDRAWQSIERRWLHNRLIEWRRNVDGEVQDGGRKIAYLFEVHTRRLLRGWARVITQKRIKYRVMHCLLERKQQVAMKRIWKIWSGKNNTQKALVVVAKNMGKHVRTVFLLWRQASLLVPSFSVVETVNRLPHRALLQYVVKLWRKHARKIKAAMFKIHPQFRLMKAWNLWRRHQRQLITARHVTDAVQNTVQALFLSSVMRQWLHVTVVPASEAEETLNRKLNTKLMIRFLGHFVEYNKWVKAIETASIEERKGKLIKLSFVEFRNSVQYCVCLRHKTRAAIEKYELQLLADCFYDVRDDVLEGLLLDESVREMVKLRTHTAYLWSGFEAFYAMWEEASIFKERESEFRAKRIDWKLMREGFTVLQSEVEEMHDKMAQMELKYKERNEAAFRIRVFNNLCCAVENQQQQYDEAEQSIRMKYHTFLMSVGLTRIFEDAHSERETEQRARMQYQFRVKVRLQRWLLSQMAHWLKYSRSLEEKALGMHSVFLLREGFRELLWASQMSIDPGLLKQVLRRNHHKRLVRAFNTFRSKLRRRQHRYESFWRVRGNSRKFCLQMHSRAWLESFQRRKTRRQTVSDAHRRNYHKLSGRSFYAWLHVLLYRLWLGTRLVRVRKRFLTLNVKDPMIHRWKLAIYNMKRLLAAYRRIVRWHASRQVATSLNAWHWSVVTRRVALRTIEGIILRQRFKACRKQLYWWSRCTEKRIQSLDLSISHREASRRKHLQKWRSFVVEQHSVQDRARTYHVIIKTLKAKRHRELKMTAFLCFTEFFFGARRLSCSVYRRMKWQHLRAVHGSLLRRSFLTWRRHWVEVEQLGEALRRVLSQRRIKVDLHQPFWAWVRYVEDKLNIRRETALVHKTSKILKSVLDVFGEPLLSDFSVRAERAYTLDDLIVLLRKYQHHNSNLKEMASSKGSGFPYVAIDGPMPYSHHVTTIGKTSTNSQLLGLSPSKGAIISTPPLWHATNSTSVESGTNPEKYFGASLDRFNKKLPQAHTANSLDVKRELDVLFP